MSQEFVEFNNGAKRSDVKPMYCLIPEAGLRRTAIAFTEGHLKYSESLTDINWKKGDEAFAAEAFNHVVAHLWDWYSGKTDEDHGGHAAAGINMLLDFEERGLFPPRPVVEEEAEEVAPEPVPEEKTKRIAWLMGAVKALAKD
jgi:hypothetical protein